MSNAILVCLGLCLGSFVNALVWRIYMQSSDSKRIKSKKSKTQSTKLEKLESVKYSVLKGRSMCPHCRHELGAEDLVPVLSWVSLGGKCRYCRKPIHWQYPLVELVTGLLFLISYMFWPYGLNGPLDFTIFISWLVLLTGFIALVVYDMRWMILPNRLVYPMTVMAFISAVISIASSGEVIASSVGVLFSVAIAGGIFYLIFQFSGGRWIGGGDVKLGVLIGLLLQDPTKAFLMLFLASVIGTLVVLPGLTMKYVNRQTKLPFGPFLITAAVISYIFGDYIIDWYIDSVLLMGLI